MLLLFWIKALLMNFLPCLESKIAIFQFTSFYERDNVKTQLMKDIKENLFAQYTMKSIFLVPRQNLKQASTSP